MSSALAGPQVHPYSPTQNNSQEGASWNPIPSLIQLRGQEFCLTVSALWQVLIWLPPVQRPVNGKGHYLSPNQPTHHCAVQTRPSVRILIQKRAEWQQAVTHGSEHVCWAATVKSPLWYYGSWFDLVCSPGGTVLSTVHHRHIWSEHWRCGFGDPRLLQGGRVNGKLS